VAESNQRQKTSKLRSRVARRLGIRPTFVRGWHEVKEHSESVEDALVAESCQSANTRNGKRPEIKARVTFEIRVICKHTRNWDVLYRINTARKLLVPTTLSLLVNLIANVTKSF
jgi:hypothetical protein